MLLRGKRKVLFATAMSTIAIITIKLVRGLRWYFLEGYNTAFQISIKLFMTLALFVLMKLNRQAVKP